MHIERVRHPRGEQWFSIRVRPDGVRLIAGGEAGLRYGRSALVQLCAGPSRVRSVDIEDWPDFPVRGVMLDISRDKVPTMATLRQLVDLLATWRINQLQLYMEHTFAYRGHEAVWRGASPMTGPQLEALDRYCRARGIELVPNQNCFGHMERWLKHPRYAKLAEMAGAWKTPFGTMRDKPSTLCPLDAGSIKLVSSLLGQLLPHFSSRSVNVGCDETFELGQGRSREACRRRGVGRVYFDYLLKVYREVRRRGRRMMFWSDIVLEHLEVVRRLPSFATALIWGYESDHPFDRQCKLVRSAGLEFYVCPGTSSWCSFSGRTTNGLANLRRAAEAGLRRGATGYLITDWGDFGHRQYLPASYAGLLYGAVVSWCAKSNREIDVAEELSRRVFDDATGVTGKLWCDVGRVHEHSGVSIKNRTVLFSIIDTPLSEVANIKGLTPARIRRMLRRIGELATQLRRAQFSGANGALVRQELTATLVVLRHACRRALAVLQDRRVPRATWRALAADIRRIMQQHRRLWLARNRPGGLDSSLAYYQKLLDEYLAQST